MAVFAETVSFPESAFVPLAVGFFGLATGYLIYGPEELFKLPTRNRAVDLTTGIWGIFMPGLMQFLTPRRGPDERPEPTKLSERGEQALGFFHIGTGLWLIYLTFAATLNIASGMDLPL